MDAPAKVHEQGAHAERVLAEVDVGVAVVEIVAADVPSGAGRSTLEGLAHCSSSPRRAAVPRGDPG